jgi:hypothetical protein
MKRYIAVLKSAAYCTAIYNKIKWLPDEIIKEKVI